MRRQMMMESTFGDVPAGFFCEWSIEALAAALRAGEISSRSLVDHALASIARLDPVLNAFTVIDAEGAHTSALAADAEMASGLDRGPLHGIPVAIKDIIDVAGLRTTSGSALHQHRVATIDAVCVQRLREGGAVIIGKTVLHEFAYGATGDRSVHGASRNPHDPSRISGGSSGGSAVAVAAGMVPMALGTDTAGSVRVPAALCGIFGFKPAFGAIPVQGVRALAASLDHVGLFTRYVDDARLVYAALVGEDISRGEMNSDVRLGLVLPGTETDPRVLETCRHALATTSVVASTVSPEGLEGLFETFSTIQSAEAFHAHRDDVAAWSDAIDPEVLARLEQGRNVPAWSYLDALATARAFASSTDDLLRRFDVLVLPTVPTISPVVGQRRLIIGEVEAEVRKALLSLTYPWNVSGSPALTLPVGMLNGMPVGLQLVCGPGREGLMFDLAARIERAVEWPIAIP